MNVQSPENTGPISVEEIDLLLSTARDQTDSLRARLDVLESTRTQALIFVFLCLLLTPVGFVANFLSDAWSRAFETAQIGTMFLVMGVLAFGLGIMVMSKLLLRVRRAASEVKRLAEILLIIVRRTSQLRDRHNFSLSQSMYVDIALANAEVAVGEARKALKGTFWIPIHMELRDGREFST